VLLRPASLQHLFGPERQDAHAVIHCPDDDVCLLKHAVLALCLAAEPVREVRSVSAEGGQASIRRNSYNDHVPKIAVIAFKPAEFTVKLGIYLTIVNRVSNYNQYIISEETPIRNLTLCRICEADPQFNGIFCFAAPRHPLSAAARTVETLWHAIGQLLAAFSPSECANYITDAGYRLPIRVTL
jgi:hypothetical protein